MLWGASAGDAQAGHMTSSLPARTDVTVIGAGQAGLTMSWQLQRAGREHVLLDRRSTLGGGWQDRWDAFRLVGPNWSASFPDAPYDGADPDGYMPRDELIGRVAEYAGRISAPVILDVSVEHLRPAADGEGFELRTSQVRCVRARSSWQPAASTSRTFPPWPPRCRRASSACTRATTGASRTSRRARCSSSAPARPGSRSPRSCARPD